AVAASPTIDREKLTVSEPAAAAPEPSIQNAQTATPAIQPGESAAETVKEPRSETRLEIKEAKTDAKPEAKIEARSETKSSTPAHQANAKQTKALEQEQELAVVKQSGATPASHKQAP